MEIWSFETIHFINFNTQRQKRHVVTNDVKVNLLTNGFVGCIEIMLFLLTYVFFIILSMCAMEFAEKFTLIHFAQSLHDLKMTDHTFKILTVDKVKDVGMETYDMITKKFNQN